MSKDDNIKVFPPTMQQAEDPRDKDATWTLLPVDTSDGRCSQCAVKHEPDEPHDAHSLAYHYSFYAEHDRWPTWTDALAHCTPEMQKRWKALLREHGVEV